ncbi:hypothetical protein [uncultured Pseudoteredinibacter sp.]|uniref:hypothetical protein n=1 Tax=uncultured Pseudoteredinibacter sp. TaxID=1641701 RepID=UPI002608FEF6|nr:hypothetical protein [uncultured Pseudoteredinibacter sp.]
MPKPLKLELQDHYQSAKLTDKQLARLNSLQELNHSNSKRRAESLTESSSAKQFSNRLFPKWALACCFLLAVMAFFQYQWRPLDDPWPKADAIAAEVVYNHLKQRPLDFIESDFHELKQSFVQLDFRLQKSALLDSFIYGGGRYCSLLSIPAAQIRSAKSIQGEYETLYQVDYRESIFGALPKLVQGQASIIRYHKGVAVEIWVDKGILFAKTRSI